MPREVLRERFKRREGGGRGGRDTNRRRPKSSELALRQLDTQEVKSHGGI